MGKIPIDGDVKQNYRNLRIADIEKTVNAALDGEYDYKEIGELCGACTSLMKESEKYKKTEDIRKNQALYDARTVFISLEKKMGE